MDFEIVKEALQAQFPGQFVLYVDDIAKILGKSKKATSNLITRNSLPFEVRKLGQKRCVDIFEVAKWLSSDNSMAREVTGSEDPQQAEKDSQPSARLSDLAKARQVDREARSPKVLGQLSAQEPEFGPYAKAILQRRKLDARRLQIFALGLQGTDDLTFMLDVIDEMVFSSSVVQLTYTVTVTNLAPTRRGVWANKSKRCFETERAAVEFATTRFRTPMRYGRMSGSQLKIEFDGHVIFWCVDALGAGLKVIHNEMNLLFLELIG